MRFAIVTAAALFVLSQGASANLSDKPSDEALIAEAERLFTETTVQSEAKSGTETKADVESKADVENQSTAVAEQKESEIPIVMKAATQEKTSESSVVWRLVGSIALVFAIASALVFATRKWGRAKDKGGQKTRIDILHQMHLGPRRSLAMIRVAGETMLIGITDHNVNLIKTVTLIDEETEAAFKAGFNNFLEDEFSLQDVRSALNSRT